MNRAAILFNQSAILKSSFRSACSQEIWIYLKIVTSFLKPKNVKVQLFVLGGCWWG